ncbi:Uncharacterised protein [Nocardiopsis dassonvillei]|uniref:Uncharacterized protein n=1 Tax=Nocardiopsis dassonvillei (strain ATCC 23218 / DSM 43111 / CIP 107115 / JCM 7437 / KCTC 9190 / NBRC 14626 / NCTC 10488 / NRRL B-5397 / IMRU 509) TaxID=446468 RepID=D7B3X8_NOCDD|nr:hypothetical protein Ndas_1509 [Nocardiopsis dassonvillei subsp. dassonvillei DSM 43111]VEI86718.1 Uncharacterised protein [Nocardiopsis dassonvillei]
MVGLCCVGTNGKQALQPRATTPAPVVSAGDDRAKAKVTFWATFSDAF